MLHISKTLHISFRSLVISKLWQWWHRSIYKYVLASFLLAIGIALASNDLQKFWIILVISIFVLMMLSLTVIVISSLIYADKYKGNLYEVVLTDKNFILTDLLINKILCQGWINVRNIYSNRTYYYLEFKKSIFIPFGKNYIVIQKSYLDQNQIAAFNEFINNRKFHLDS